MAILNYFQPNTVAYHSNSLNVCFEFIVRFEYFFFFTFSPENEREALMVYEIEIKMLAGSCRGTMAKLKLFTVAAKILNCFNCHIYPLHSAFNIAIRRLRLGIKFEVERAIVS